MKRLLVFLFAVASASLAFGQGQITAGTYSGSIRVAATAHSVSLSWTAANGAVGYNLYRAVIAGGPYVKINSDVDGDTQYSDNTVASGQTYYYVAKSVGFQAQESDPSNEAQAVVPNP